MRWIVSLLRYVSKEINSLVCLYVVNNSYWFVAAGLYRPAQAQYRADIICLLNLGIYSIMQPTSVWEESHYYVYFGGIIKAKVRRRYHFHVLPI